MKKIVKLFTLFIGLQANLLQAAQDGIEQLPEGVSYSYYDAIHDALDRFEGSGVRPVLQPDQSPFVSIDPVTSERIVDPRLIVATNPYLSHLISQYIPEDEVDLNDCKNAIKSNDMDKFKNSLELLKIYQAKFSESKADKNFINLKFKDNHSYDHDWTLLTWAIYLDRPEMVKIVLDAGVDKNALDNYINDAPLHSAIRFNKPGMVKILLDAGADKNINGRTPLGVAILFNRPEIIKLLLDAGADMEDKYSQATDRFAQNSPGIQKALEIQNLLEQARAARATVAANAAASSSK